MNKPAPVFQAAARDARWHDWLARQAQLKAELVPTTAEHGVPALDGEALRAELATALAKITPAAPEAVRAHTFATVIAPRLQAMGFEERYRVDGLIDGPDPRAAEQRSNLAKVVKRFAGVGAIVALVGPRGTGKTSIAAALAQARLWEDWAAVSAYPRQPGAFWRLTGYYKCTDLVARFKARYGDWGTTKTDELEAGRKFFIREDCVVIDEWHEAAEDSRHKDRILTDLLDARYSARRDTLIISNQTREAFQASLNDSLQSRLREHGSVIACEWEDFRRRPAAQRSADSGQKSAGTPGLDAAPPVH